MHPGFIDYMKKVLRIAIEDLQADLIHFDNTSSRAAPPIFHHPMGVKDFREYLQNKYSSEERKDRIGFSDVTYIEPPLHDGRLDRINDPVFQEWTDFRCQQLADFYGEMAAYIHSLNPKVVVENNPSTGLSGLNTMWEQGVDYPRLLAHTDVIWNESSNEASIRNGILVSKIRTYKMATLLNNRIFTFTSDSPIQLAEAMTYNRQCLGMIGGLLIGLQQEKRENYGWDDPYTWGGDMAGFDFTTQDQEYVRFNRDNFNHFKDVQTVADVAVLRSYATMAYNNGRPYQSTYLVEQSLIENRIPFEIVFDQQLEDLQRYRVLVLADQECLSDRQIDLIRAFVREGGGLVATEHTSLYNEQRRRRADFGLQELFGVKPPRWPARDVLPEPILEISPVRRKIGAGRVVYLPEVKAALEKPPTAPMTWQYWKTPENVGELIDAIRWAAGTLSSEVTAGKHVTAEILEREDEELLLHLINYGAVEQPIQSGIKVEMELPESRSVLKVEVLSPDPGMESTPIFETKAGRVHFTIPKMNIYSLAVVTLGE